MNGTGDDPPVRRRALPRDVPNGLATAASPWPFAGPLEGVFPEGLCVYQFDPETGGYGQNAYVDGTWEGDGGGAAPQLAVGESFFIDNPSVLLRWDGPGRLRLAFIDP